MSSLGLLGTYGSNSSSSEEETEEAEAHGPPVVLSNPFLSGNIPRTLPKPSFMQEIKDFTDKDNRATPSMASEMSVFRNPFRDREVQKKAVLERHVTMTTKQEDLKTIDGRKVCWNFRKGRCRFGHKCTFAHDSDVKTMPTPTKEPTPIESVAQNATSQAPASVKEPMTNYDEGAVITGEDSQGIGKRKKRPGLSDGLVPGKKAMKFYNKVYQNEPPP
ncbi:uncharacterized protein LOC131888711 [Tigriopus californicus]|nr:uncharacterized protein LOC131888711 [Tigriopus californicus]